MQWLVNLLRGYVEVEVYGAFPERLLNLCAQNGVGFWNLRWVDATTFRFTVSFRAYRQLNKLAQRAMCELRAPREQGLPALALGLRLCGGPGAVHPDAERPVTIYPGGGRGGE